MLEGETNTEENRNRIKRKKEKTDRQELARWKIQKHISIKTRHTRGQREKNAHSWYWWWYDILVACFRTEEEKVQMHENSQENYIR